MAEMSYTVTRSSQPVHSVIINRTSTMTKSSSDTSRSGASARSGAPDVPFTEGEFSLQTAKGVGEVKTSREHEKKDLQDLNDRFANYLDKVRNLEAQNRKLADELEKLKAKWGKETQQIKSMYQAELDEARHALDEAEMEKARLEIRVSSLEELINEIRIKIAFAQSEIVVYRERLESQTQLLLDYESEVEMLRKQLESFEKEKEKDKATIAKLEDLLKTTRDQLDDETLRHIDAENRRQTLEEEIEFLKSVHEQEMKELAALAYRGNSPETRDYWKNQLLQAIREIEQMYNDKMEDAKTDMESNYNLKLTQFRTAQTADNSKANAAKDDCKDLRNAVTDLRDRINDLDGRNNQLLREIEALRREKEDRERELEAENAMLRDDQNNLRNELNAIMKELQNLLGAKSSLDLEIAAYRKLLEGEEKRTGGGLFREPARPAVEDDDEPGGSSAKGEMSAKTTYSRTAKGTIAVIDCPPNGLMVRLENTGKKEENIQGYKIQRLVDNRPQPEYVLDERFVSFPAGTKIALWAKGSKPAKAPATDLEIEEPTWGIGSLVITTLINAEGEDRASLTQKTVYS